MDTEVGAFFHEMGSQQTARRVIGSPETDPGRWNPPPAGQDVQWLWVGRCLCLRCGVCNQPGLGHLRRAYNQHGLCHRRLVYKKPCLCHRQRAFKQLCLLSGFLSVGRTTGFAFVLGIWCTSSLALVLGISRMPLSSTSSGVYATIPMASASGVPASASVPLPLPRGQRQC